VPCKSVDAAESGRSNWIDIDAMFPRSAVIGVALIPRVVVNAALLPPPRRQDHVAFVANVAFGGCRDAARVPGSFAEPCLASTTATVKRILRDACSGSTWEPWEAQYLLAACTRVLGRLRAVLAASGPSRAGETITSDLEHETAAWLLAMPYDAQDAPVEDRVVAHSWSRAQGRRAEPHRLAGTAAAART